MSIKQELFFTGGMNLDQDHSSMAPNKYILARNFTLSSIEDGDKGNLVNLLGTQAIGVQGTNIVTFTNSLGTFTLDNRYDECIGHCFSSKDMSTYLFFSNMTQGDSILRYNEHDDTVDKIIYHSSILKFNRDYPIYDAHVIDNLLLWTDNLNEPRSINITRCYNTTNNVSGTALSKYTSGILEEFTYAIKKIDVGSLSATLGTDTNIKTNNIFGNVFLFYYRVQYDDYSFSPISNEVKITLNTNENIFGGSTDIDIYNYISVSLNSFKENVVNIEFYVKQSKIGYLSRINTINKFDTSGNIIIGSNITLSFNFFNDITYEQLSEAESLKLFDAVPIQSLNQEVINGNRIVYSNIKDSYDPYNITASLGLENVSNSSLDKYKVIEKSYDMTYGQTDYISGGEGMTQIQWSDPELPEVQLLSGWDADIEFRVLDLRNIVTTKGLYEISVTKGVDTKTFKKVITADINTSVVASFRTEILNWLKTNYYENPDSYSPRNIYELGDSYSSPRFFIDYANNFKINEGTNDNLPGDDFDILTYWDGGNSGDFTTKYGSNHDNCALLLMYYIEYNFESGYVSRNDWNGRFFNVFNVKITPAVSSESYQSLRHNSIQEFGIVYLDQNFRTNGYTKIGSVNTDNRDNPIIPKVTINNTPPSWAKYYQIAYNNMLSDSLFFQAVSSSINQTKDSDSSYFDINIALKANLAKNNNYNNPIYEFKKGDRIKVIGYFNGNDLIKHSGSLIDVGVTKTDTDGVFTERIDASKYTGVDFTKAQLVEVYTPNKGVDTSNAFYLIDKPYAITNGYHTANTQTQTNSVPAILTLHFGNSYFRVSQQETKVFYLEAKDQSDYFDSEILPLGKPIGLVQQIESNLKTGMRVGGQKIAGSKVNELFKFDPIDLKILPTAFGEINGMREVGHQLACYLTNKVIHIYINRTVPYDGAGQQQILLSETILSTTNASQKDFGCQHKGSISKHNDKVFFYDSIRSCLVMDYVQSQVAISNNGMHAYFIKLSKNVKTGTNVKVKSIYDLYTKMYLLSVETTVDSITETKVIGFADERENGGDFIGEFDFFPDAFIRTTNSIGGVVNGNIHIHNRDFNNRNTIYGSVLESLVASVTNQSPTKAKIFNAIRLGCTMPMDTIMTCENGKVTRMVSGAYKKKEETYVTDIFRDMRDDNGTIDVTLYDGTVKSGSIERLFNGERLRDTHSIITLTSSSTDKIMLRSVMVSATESNYNG